MCLTPVDCWCRSAKVPASCSSFLTRKCLQLITGKHMLWIQTRYGNNSCHIFWGFRSDGGLSRWWLRWCQKMMAMILMRMMMIAMARFWVGLTPTVAPVVHLLSPITLNRRILFLCSAGTPPLLVHPCLLYVCTYQSVIQLPLLSSTAPSRTTFNSAPPLAPLVFAMKYVCQVLVISHWAALTLLAHPAGGHDATMLMITMLLMIPMMMTVICWSWWRQWWL